MSPATSTGIVAIVPAAGQSSRFGSMKLLARVDGELLLDRTISSLLGAHVDRVVVVIGPRVDLGAVRAFSDPRVTTVINVDPERGMFSSMQVGLETLFETASEPRVVLILPADMPFVRSATVAMVAAECLRVGQPIAAAFAGRRGHPLALPAVLVPGLISASVEGSLRDALASLGVVVAPLPVEDPGVLRDVDVPADLT